MTPYFEWMARIFALGTIVVGPLVMVALLMFAGMWALDFLVRRAPGFRLALWTAVEKRRNTKTADEFFWRAFDDLARNRWVAERMATRAQAAVDRWDQEHSK